MYLSRVKIDYYNLKSIKELNHLGAYHSWVEDSFPEEREKPKNERKRKLWRVERRRLQMIKLFVATNEKLYLFEKNIIKNQYYIKNLKNVVYDSGKIYLFSEDLKIFNAKDLKPEKTVDIGDDYMKSYILSKDILLVKKNGYVLIDKSTFKTREFSAEILDSIQSEDSVYLIQKDRYKKIK